MVLRPLILLAALVAARAAYGLQDDTRYREWLDHAALLAQHPLTTLQTLLVWRHGYRSAALDALQQVLRD